MRGTVESTCIAFVATAVCAFIIGALQITVNMHGAFSVALSQLAGLLASGSVVASGMAWTIAICDWIAWVMEDSGG